MTVSSSTAKVSYSGNSSTVAFAVNFYFLADSHLKVVSRAADGTETVKALTTDYTVAGAGNPAGGTVTMVTAPATGTTLVIARNVPITQLTDYTANDPFPAETHEQALDKLTMEVQQINEAVARAIKLSLSNTMTSTEFTVGAADRANKVFSFDSAGELNVAQELGTYRSNWASGTAYKQRDIIKDTSNSNIYICITAHTASGTQPISSNADVAKWALIVDAAAAATSAAAASSSASAASSSASAASTSATNAATSATNAANSATAASGSASTASTQATNAGNSATAAASSASAASGSAASASSSASTATTQATNASNSATAASGSASTASTQATNASNSAAAAATSETNAGNFVTSASGSASAASSSATAASGSATAASGSASAASSSATAAAGSATAAAGSATAAAASALEAVNKVAKTSDTGSAVLPKGTTGQRDGTPLSGYLRFNTTTSSPEIYNGTAWGSVGGGATGAGGDTVFQENSRVVTTNYTLTSGKSASTVGPITVNSGVTVTIPSGERLIVL